jgi:hypothetical protein
MKKFIIIGALLALASPVLASHSWGGYHWARTTNTFTLKLGSNVSSPWDSVLATTSADWSQSTVLDTTLVAGLAGRNCKPTAGRVEVCNRTYGNNGWLGIAQIWITGGTHITQATTKMNDTYFNTAKYNTLAWRNMVMCQEVGHAFGLDHQDENFDNSNLDTCMDYTNDPTSNQHPNAHDYAELETIYAHTDSTTTVGASLPTGKGNSANGISNNLENLAEWGKAVGKDGQGRDNLFERDFGGGRRVLTHVYWAD